jgi:hypothetical protein
VFAVLTTSSCYVANIGTRLLFSADLSYSPSCGPICTSTKWSRKFTSGGIYKMCYQPRPGFYTSPQTLTGNLTVVPKTFTVGPGLEVEAGPLVLTVNASGISVSDVAYLTFNGNCASPYRTVALLLSPRSTDATKCKLFCPALTATGLVPSSGIASLCLRLFSSKATSSFSTNALLFKFPQNITVKPQIRSVIVSRSVQAGQRVNGTIIGFGLNGLTLLASRISYIGVSALQTPQPSRCIRYAKVSVSTVGRGAQVPYSVLNFSFTFEAAGRHSLAYRSSSYPTVTKWTSPKNTSIDVQPVFSSLSVTDFPVYSKVLLKVSGKGLNTQTDQLVTVPYSTSCPSFTSREPVTAFGGATETLWPLSFNNTGLLRVCYMSYRTVFATATIRVHPQYLAANASASIVKPNNPFFITVERLFSDKRKRDRNVEETVKLQGPEHFVCASYTIKIGRSGKGVSAMCYFKPKQSRAIYGDQLITVTTPQRSSFKGHATNVTVMLLAVADSVAVRPQSGRPLVRNGNTTVFIVPSAFSSSSTTAPVESFDVVLRAHLGVPMTGGLARYEPSSTISIASNGAAAGAGATQLTFRRQGSSGSYSTSLSQSLQDGVATFALELQCPLAGRYYFTVSRVPTKGFTLTSSFQILVTPGRPSKLILVTRQPASWVVNGRRFPISPTVKLIDACGNDAFNPNVRGSVSNIPLDMSASATSGLTIAIAPSYTATDEFGVASFSRSVVTGATTDGDVLTFTVSVRSSSAFATSISSVSFTASVVSCGASTTTPQRHLMSTPTNFTLSIPFLAVEQFDNIRCLVGGGPTLVDRSAQVATRSWIPTFVLDSCHVRCYLPRRTTPVKSTLTLRLGNSNSTWFSVPYSAIGAPSQLRALRSPSGSGSSSSVLSDEFIVTSIQSTYTIPPIRLQLLDAVGNTISSTEFPTLTASTGPTVSMRSKTIGSSIASTTDLVPDRNGQVLFTPTILNHPPDTILATEFQYKGLGANSTLKRLTLVKLDRCLAIPRSTALTTERCKPCAESATCATACPSRGPGRIRVTGNNFGLTGATLLVGDIPCGKTEHYGSTVLYGWNCSLVFSDSSPLLNRTVRVINKYGSTGQVGVLRFNPVPIITKLQGCARQVGSTTQDCSIYGWDSLIISGSGFGARSAQVDLVREADGLQLRCKTIRHLIPDVKLNCSRFPGSGRGWVVRVTNSYGEVSRSLLSIDYEPTFESNCLVSALNSRRCGFGECNILKGLCTCYKSSDLGFWTGSTCDSCAATHWGSACKNPCLGYSPDTATVCSQHGTCSSGLSGSGTCSCDFGYSGVACEVTCKGGVLTPCSGHGICLSGAANGACLCNRSDATGFWGGDDCSKCLDTTANTTYKGDRCQYKCPVYRNKICNGNGTCTSFGKCKCNTNYCGTYCSQYGAVCKGLCPTGTYGPTCVACPGVSQPCSGHGRCNDGAAGDGSCDCQAGYWSADCRYECPGGAANICSGHGTCDSSTGSCTCQASADGLLGYSGPKCDITCAGLLDPALPLTSTPCNGHGTCLYGATSDGSCKCTQGYTGRDCSQECPGGRLTPCSLHGTCLGDGTCSCYQSAATGYWSGTTCDTCAPGWFTIGSQLCVVKCEFAEGAECAGHGTCAIANDGLIQKLVCQCNSESELGFWDGRICTVCKSGYYGPGCFGECPGGSCTPCNLHGRCSDGRSGTGLCTCNSDSDFGFWTGLDCSDCEPGYWGPDCLNKCPFCDHGRCNAGPFGDGKCTCDFDPVLGYWNYSDPVNASAVRLCSVCADGYYGQNCTSRCPGVNLTCSGHGQCAGGTSGSGACICVEGYIGLSCNVSCPVSAVPTRNSSLSSAAPFNASLLVPKTCGFGQCLYPFGNCSCPSNFSKDEFGSCTQCSTNRFGPLCDSECTPEHISCNGRGSCDAGRTGSGICACTRGWTGDTCTEVCPGGLNNPCHGHGTCLNSRCYCFADSVRGYWGGEECDVCQPEYLSTACTTPCPMANGLPCNGKGICWNGKCLRCGEYDRSTKWCGSTCQISGVANCVADGGCPFGFWGTNCETPCQGFSTVNGVVMECQGHGYCNSGKSGNGECVCRTGFGGPSCDKECPNSTSTVACSGHGLCGAEDGTCKCDVGYGDDDCSFACPGNPPCNGRGDCDSDLGICECYSGWAGSSCEIECVGGHDQPCNFGGECNQATGQCSCYGDLSNGFFSYPDCANCRRGYSGEQCKDRCVNGEVSGRECACYPNYAGSTCNIKCPGYVDGTRACSGHGKCNDTNRGTGECNCDAGYYGTDCSQQCSTTYCRQQFGLENPECSKDGSCACLNDTLRGRWEGETCNRCQLNWWGATCTQQCSCSDNGGCDQFTGECSCFADFTRGFWAGDHCTECASGYLGARCNIVDVQLSLAGKSTALVSTAYKEYPGVFLDDSAKAPYDDGDLRYMGSEPLIAVFNNASEFSSLSLGAPIISLVIVDDTTMLATIQNLSTAAANADPSTVPLSLTKITRGSQPQIISKKDIRIPKTSSREFSVQAASSSTTVVSTLSYNGLIYSINSNGAYSIVDVSTSTVQGSGSVTNIVAASGGALLAQGTGFVIWGASSNSWGLAFAKRPTGTPTWLTLVGGTRQIVSIQQCVAGSTELLYCAAQDNVTLVLYLFEFNTSLTSNFTAMNLSSRSTTIIPRKIVNVTAMAMDPLTSDVLLAYNGNNEGSTLMKVKTVTSSGNIETSGTTTLGSTGVDYEVIQQIQINGTSRIAYVSIPLRFQHVVREINLFGVGNVVPNVIDAAGSTIVNVYGDGFPVTSSSNGTVTSNSSSVICMFGSNSFAPGVIISSGLIQCAAPTAGDSTCGSIYFNLQYSGRATSTTTVTITRPASPQLVSLITNRGVNYGSVTEAVSVTVIGVGFVPSPYLTCKITDKEGSFLFDAAKYINETAIVCIGYNATLATGGTNLRRTDPSAVLRVSSDGSIFSFTSLPFTISGTGSALKILSPAALGSEVASDFLTTLPLVRVVVVDDRENPVGIFDTTTHSLQAKLWNSSSTTVLGGGGVSNGTNSSSSVSSITRTTVTEVSLVNSTTVIPSTGGVVEFRTLRLQSPPVGTYVLELTEVLPNGITRWSVSTTFVIVVGVPQRLDVETFYSGWTVASLVAAPLNPQIVIIVKDISGNQIRSKAIAEMPTSVRVAYFKAEVINGVAADITQNRTSPIKDDGTFVFSPPTLGIFGRSYRFAFDAFDSRGVAQTNILPYITPDIPVANCPSKNQYGHPGTIQCLPCPSHMKCDGSAVLQVEKGYWRAAQDAYVVYQCENADACVNGTCVAGYAGPMCSSCTEGFGKTTVFCNKCSDRWINILALTGIALGFALGLYLFAAFTISSSLDVDETNLGRPRDPLPVLVKMLTNHLQVVAQAQLANVDLPNSLKQYFSITTQIVQLSNINLSIFDCGLSFTWFDRFYMFMFIPIGMVVLLGIIDVLRAIVERTRQLLLETKQGTTADTEKYRSEVLDEDPDAAPMVAATGAESVPVTMVQRRKKATHPMLPLALHRWLAGSLVMLFLLYADVMQRSVEYFKCESINEGESRPERLALSVAPGYTCFSDRHRNNLPFAILFTLFYGLGIPSLTVAVILLTSRYVGDMLRARAMYYFVTGGFHKEYWFWDTVVMTRKGVLIFIMVFVTDRRIQLYLAMWLMVLNLALQAYAMPHEIKMLSQLETTSLASLFATFNLLLLYDQVDQQTQGAYYWALTGVIMTINIVVIIVFGYFIGVAAKLMASGFYKKHRRRFEEILLRSKYTKKLINYEDTQRAMTAMINYAQCIVSKVPVVDPPVFSSRFGAQDPDYLKLQIYAAELESYLSHIDRAGIRHENLELGLKELSLRTRIVQTLMYMLLLRERKVKGAKMLKKLQTILKEDSPKKILIDSAGENLAAQDPLPPPAIRLTDTTAAAEFGTRSPSERANDISNNLPGQGPAVVGADGTFQAEKRNPNTGFELDAADDAPFTASYNEDVDPIAEGYLESN